MEYAFHEISREETQKRTALPSSQEGVGGGNWKRLIR
jgi:hypothetical protein